MKTPKVMVKYTNEVIDGGDFPQFKVTPEDDPSNAITEASANACLKKIVYAVLQHTPKAVSSISGVGM